MTTTSRGSSRAQMMPRLQVWGRAVGISGIRDMLVQVVDDWWRILANSDINTMDGKDNKPFKQCTTTSNSPFASSASSSSVQMLLDDGLDLGDGELGAAGADVDFGDGVGIGAGAAAGERCGGHFF
jgi:hypothetical protein